jgi:hypothetical protein
MTDLRTAEQLAADQAARRRARNQRRATRSRHARTVARWGQELASKPRRRQIATWLRRHREWRRKPRGYEPQPPRTWLWGMVRP